jgi:hypothetical protein
MICCGASVLEAFLKCATGCAFGLERKYAAAMRMCGRMNKKKNPTADAGVRIVVAGSKMELASLKRDSGYSKCQSKRVFVRLRLSLIFRSIVTVISKTAYSNAH